MTNEPERSIEEQNILAYAGALHACWLRYLPVLLKEKPELGEHLVEMLRQSPDEVKIAAGLFEAEYAANEAHYDR